MCYRLREGSHLKAGQALWKSFLSYAANKLCGQAGMEHHAWGDDPVSTALGLPQPDADGPVLDEGS